MNLPFFGIMGECFFLVILISGIPLAAASLGGLIVSVLQTATQIQEQSVGFIVKVTVVASVLLGCAGWFAQKIVGFFHHSISLVSAMGRLAY